MELSNFQLNDQTKKGVNSLIGLFLLGIAFLSVFKQLFNKLSRISLFEYADEFILFISLFLLASIMLLRAKQKAMHVLLTIVVIYSIGISMLFGLNRDLTTVTLQTLITLKFFIIAITFISLFRNRIGIVRKFFFWTLNFAFFGFLIHLLLGKSFNEFIGTPTFARPTIRYAGFFPHPNHMAYLSVLYIGLILKNTKMVGKNLNLYKISKIALLLSVIFLTDSRTSIVAVGIFFAGFYWNDIIANYKILISFLVLLFASIAFLWLYTGLFSSINENIRDSLSLSSHYIRGNMIYLSVIIFYQFFPFGTGSATFGSVLSNNRVYELYGQADRYYFSNRIGIYDSNIASWIGEYGFIGLIILMMLFIMLKRHLGNISPSKPVMLTSLIVVFLFFAITNPVFTNNVYILLSVPVFILFASSDASKKTVV